MTHYSKKDSWLVGLVLVSIIGPLVLGFLFITVGGPLRPPGVTSLTIGAVTGLVVLALTYPLYYKITGDELVIRCGLIVNEHIRLSSIVRVQPTRSPLSAPAWSFDRLRVAYLVQGREKFTLISPNDKPAFLHDLAAVTELTWNGECLERQE